MPQISEKERMSHSSTGYTPDRKKVKNGGDEDEDSTGEEGKFIVGKSAGVAQSGKKKVVQKLKMSKVTSCMKPNCKCHGSDGRTGRTPDADKQYETIKSFVVNFREELTENEAVEESMEEAEKEIMGESNIPIQKHYAAWISYGKAKSTGGTLSRTYQCKHLNSALCSCKCRIRYIQGSGTVDLQWWKLGSAHGIANSSYFATREMHQQFQHVRYEEDSKSTDLPLDLVAFVEETLFEDRSLSPKDLDNVIGWMAH